MHLRLKKPGIYISANMGCHVIVTLFLCTSGKPIWRGALNYFQYCPFLKRLVALVILTFDLSSSERYKARKREPHYGT